MLRPGHVVFLCALALLCVGVVMVSSASMSIEPVEVLPLPAVSPVDGAGMGGGGFPSDSLGEFLHSILFSRSTAYMILAVGAMCLAAALPVERLASFLDGGRGPVGGQGSTAAARLNRRESRHGASRYPELTVSPSWGWWWGGVVLLLIIVSMAYWPGIGREVNGSHRWVQFPVAGLRDFSFQPSEIAKWGMVALLAVYCAVRGGSRHGVSGAPAEMQSFSRGLMPALAGLGLVAGAVAYEDLGTGVLIAAAGSIVLIAGGARFWHFLLFVPPAAAGFIGLVIASPYRLRRIETFFDPYLDPQGAGYHMIQSMAAVAGGEGFGRGLGHGLQKFGYLPEDTTDFLFAIICEELGIAGAAAVICLYIMLLWAGLAIIRAQQFTVLKVLGLGIMATVGLQALINLAVVTGLGPTKGIALPLVSAGGTGWILTAASLGLLVAMDRAERTSEAPEEDCSPAPKYHPALC